MRSLLYFLAGVLLTALVALAILKQKTVATYGPAFNMMHLELPESKEHMEALVTTIPDGAKALVLRQLNFDYLFMVGCFGGLMVLCLLAKRRIGDINMAKKTLNQPLSGAFWAKLLTMLTFLQLLAWGIDIWENATLEQWFNNGVIDTSFDFFTIRVYLKFLIAFGALGVAVGVLLGTMASYKKLKRQVEAKPVV